MLLVVFRFGLRVLWLRWKRLLFGFLVLIIDLVMLFVRFILFGV